MTNVNLNGAALRLKVRPWHKINSVFRNLKHESIDWNARKSYLKRLGTAFRLLS